MTALIIAAALVAAVLAGLAVSYRAGAGTGRSLAAVDRAEAARQAAETELTMLREGQAFDRAATAMTEDEARAEAMRWARP